MAAEMFPGQISICPPPGADAKVLELNAPNGIIL
jgi:hypothetical protein